MTSQYPLFHRLTVIVLSAFFCLCPMISEGNPGDSDEPIGPDSLDEPIGPDSLDEPIGPDSLDEPIGPDSFDEPIGPDSLDDKKQSENPKPIESKSTNDEGKSQQAVGSSVVRLKNVSIIGNAERVSRVSGSAHQVKEEELEQQNYDDVHRVLKQVPGVYVRDEDGLGLRPNIGLRGANSDRSAKVTLMEDGVLMAPAPYSAPAAYYFPLTTRLTAVEVFKGPASIQYGPQTIGGALNMSTRRTPLNGFVGSIDGSYGQYGTAKAHSYLGWGGEQVGVLLEGINLSTDGFKELDQGGDTGFNKSELMFKARVNSDPNAEFFHQLELKLGWAVESSKETYLGLSKDDFDLSPYRRYVVTELAEMSWDRLQGKVDYALSLGDHFELNVTAYRHQLSRGWEKLIGFNNNEVSFEGVLAAPSNPRNQSYYRILTGEEDSTSENGSDKLRLGLNDRSYLSQGIQGSVSYRAKGERWKNHLQLGLRVHQDQITRHHSQRLAAVQSGRLVAEDQRSELLNNLGETTALSAFLFDEIGLGERLRLTPGLRLERYETMLTDLDNSNVISGDDTVWLPGIGLWYTLTDHWGTLAGVHRGFSPLSLSQTGQSDPEQSINYEVGTRWRYQDFEGEGIAFLNDYKNLVGTCTQSAGCQVEQLDQQFNAGSALIYGLEFVTKYELYSGSYGGLSSQLSYTYTHGRFSESFRSDFAQWGEVEEGDALPYVPEHQANLKLNWISKDATWGLGLSDTLISPMLDSAGLFNDETMIVPAQHILDANAFWQFTPNWQTYLTVDNVLNSAYLTSIRPFGHRPGKPLLIQIGARYTL